MAEYKIHQQPLEEKPLLNWLEWASKYWFQTVIALFLVHLYLDREVNVQVNMDGRPVKASLVSNKIDKAKAQASDSPDEDGFSLASLVEDDKPLMTEDRPHNIPSKWKTADFNNLSFVLSPDLADRKGVDPKIVKEKLDNCRNYVERFAATAMAEMEKFGIPASITLAQGLIETDAGGSRMASESNNHFGIKCRSKCKGCTCRNYSDDDVYDMFRVFPTAWESFREHSTLLQIDRYRHLKKLGSTDYRGWAAGLKKAGYATDKNYDKKLVKLIEALDLHQFDR